MAGQTGQLALPLAFTRLESEIDRMSRRLEALKQINAILAEFPELADVLGVGTVSGSTAPAANEAHPTSQSNASNYERIRQFFAERNNQWEQAPRIGEVLGLTRGTVAT